MVPAVGVYQVGVFHDQHVFDSLLVEHHRPIHPLGHPCEHDNHAGGCPDPNTPVSLSYFQNCIDIEHVHKINPNAALTEWVSTFSGN